MASKPSGEDGGKNVIDMSNGYPSGPHFNLNIHGRNPDTFYCENILGGNSINICEYGESTIQYVSNKKSSLTELMVLDPCAECLDVDSKPAKVQLPHEAEGYYVFARLRGKTNNGKEEEPSNVILYPNDIVELCNDDLEIPDPEFPNYTDCSLILGMITVQGDLYNATPGENGSVKLERFDTETTRGKGYAKAKYITDLFMWSGWSCDATLDTYPMGGPDGVIDENDVPIEYDYIENGGNENGIIDKEELQAWLNNVCDYHDNEWILNIADLVVSQQKIDNDGGKLLKIRFYPKATTDFTPAQ